MATSNLDDELKCALCLELFQDPRSLPCLHTFCQECIKRSLKENRSLKCPICRAKHELSEEEAVQLPVNQYALQELPFKRLQQQENKQECGFCGEILPVAAWCDECGLICKNCLDLHGKMKYLKSHSIVDSGQTSVKQLRLVSACLSHSGLECKYLCSCYKMVCSECLLEPCHETHTYVTVEKVYGELRTKIEDLKSLVNSKREELSEYLKKAGDAESKAQEYSELMKSKVNNVFDGIVASVETQRNEALQSVSQGVKDIWAEKEKVEVDLAQLDSFTRFADYTDKCTTNASYVAMAIQSIKLMDELKNTHGDKAVLDKKEMAIGTEHIEGSLNVPLDKLFSLGHPSLKISPAQGSVIRNLTKGLNKIFTSVSLMAGDLPILFPQVTVQNCKLDVKAEYRNQKVPVEVSRVNHYLWKIMVAIKCNENTYPLMIECRLSGAMSIELCCTFTA